jgi:hypothetical protein
MRALVRASMRPTVSPESVVRTCFDCAAEKRCGRLLGGEPAATSPVWDGEGWGRDRDRVLAVVWSFELA